ncbi:MAG: ATP-binding protein, partial [Bryobacteraceae bacterium]
EAIGGALEEVERLGRFVQGMLSLSLAESGQLALRKEQIDVAEISHSIAEQFKIPAEEARVTLSVEAPESLAAEVDRLLFERLVSNLLSNAIKYTPPEGKVTLRLAAVGDFVELIVEDTGCGIPVEHLPRIFDRLYRVPGENTARKRGLGLGLSFVSWIAQAHGGTIHVDSTVGKGSRFAVALPLRAERDGGVKPGAA